MSNSSFYSQSGGNEATANSIQTKVNEAEDAKVAAEAAQAAAEAAQGYAETAQTRAETAETNAEASETSASGSATTATTKAAEASTSATNAAASATTATTQASAAATSATNAATSASTASTKATEAATSATTASTEATAAATSASSAQAARDTTIELESSAEDHRDEALAFRNTAEDHKDDAQKLAAHAEDSQYTLSDGSTTGYSALHYNEKASDSATAAAASETAAASSATSASTSASTATTKASEASTSASSASSSASDAQAARDTTIELESSAEDHRDEALAFRNTAEDHKDDAQKLATNAEDSQYTLSDGSTTGYSALHYKEKAADSAAAAAASETAAAGSATSASSSSTTATTKASEASTSASTATTKASEASSSASSAASAQTAAEAARDSALAALDSFDDRYLGVKSSAPSQDNDGNALVSGALYFDSTDNAMKVYDGSQWLNAYASLSGALIANQNLSDLNNAATARTNLGISTVGATGAFSDLTGTPTTVSGYGITDAFDGAFSSLTGKPTTVSGYGITDAFDGAYSSLTGTPTIPSATSDLTNDSGFITSADGGNAATLDGLDSTQFLRSDVADTAVKLTFGTGNVQAPTSSDATTGARLILYPTGSGRDYSIGIESNTMWFNSDNHYKWYVDGSLKFEWDNTAGQFEIGGNVTATRFRSPNGTITPYSGITFSNVFTAEDSDNRVAYFDSDGGSGCSVWWGSGSNPYAAIDSTEGQMDVWVNPSNNVWSNIARFTTSGMSLITGSLSVGSNTVWHAGNDGSGSGLDADTVDGIQASSFLRSDTSDTITGGSTLNFQTSTGSTRGHIQATETNDAHFILATSGGEDIAFKDGGTGGTTNFLIRGDGNTFTTSNHYIGGNTAWHAGNDGSGSGLDADTLDGYHKTNLQNNTSTSFYVAGQSNRFYKVSINVSQVDGLRVWRPYSATIGGSSSYWNNGSSTHFGALSLDLRVLRNDWGGHRSRLVGTCSHNYTVVCARAAMGQSSEHGKVIMYLRGGAGGSGAIYYLTTDSHAATVSVDYNSYLTAADAEFNNSYLNRFINPHGLDHYTLKVSGSQVWHPGNDGSGSGLDADTLDGYHVNSNDRNNEASKIVRTQANGRIYGGQFYANDWFRVEGDQGFYWQGRARGITSPEQAGNSYGNVTTYNSGKGSWQGWGIQDRFVFMGRSGTDVGVHDNSLSWVWYFHRGNDCMSVKTSTTSSSYSLYVSGQIYATSNITAYSDRRAKENIVTIDNALEKVNALRGVYYNKRFGDDKQREVGVIAQEVQEVVPELVTYAEDVDEYGVKYANTVGLLIEAVKELTAKVEELEAKCQ